MKVYLDALKDVLETGHTKEDRTGTGTISKFGMQQRYDLRKGFPAMTTKRLAWKAVVSELLWFLEGSTDERRLAEILYEDTRENLIGKRTIWTDNADAKKDGIRFNGLGVGNMYGTYWRKLPIMNPSEAVYIERREFVDGDYAVVHPDIPYREYYRSGEQIQTVNDGIYTILGKSLNTETPDYSVIRFNETGYITEVARTKKSIKDRLNPNVQGKGYYGYGDMDKSTRTFKKLYGIWQFMILRCYNPRKNHNSYGDVFVCKRWLNFSEFYNDAFSLPNFQEFIDSGYGYQIDKDYFGSKLYCREACIFIPADLNKTLNAGGTNQFRIYQIDNMSFYSKSDLEIYLFNKRKRLSLDKLENLGVKILEDTSTHLIRPKIFLDPLSDIIEEIKSNPTSRRLVINSWNNENERNAVLGACHNTFQFYVQNGELSAQLYQRSCDKFLGEPFNIASYALLIHILAQICGLKVGEFVHSIGDAHIYSNHIDQVKEQLSREPGDLPTLRMPNFSNLEELLRCKVSDFVLDNYHPQDSIKAPMAV